MSRAVNSGSFDQYIGYLLEKLTENQDKYRCVDSLSEQSGKNKSPYSVQNIKLRIKHIGRDHSDLAGKNKADDYDCHYCFLSREIKSRQSVARDRAGNKIAYRGQTRKYKALPKRLPIVHTFSCLNEIGKVQGAGQPFD